MIKKMNRKKQVSVEKSTTFLCLSLINHVIKPCVLCDTGLIVKESELLKGFVFTPNPIHVSH